MITTLILALAAALIALNFRRMAAAVRRWQAHECAVTELMRLNDQTLADIGLHRGEIRSAVLEASGVYLPRERRHRRARR